MPKGKYKLICPESLVQKGSFTEKEIIADWMVWAKIPIRKINPKLKVLTAKPSLIQVMIWLPGVVNRIYRKNRDESEQIEFVWSLEQEKLSRRVIKQEWISYTMCEFQSTTQEQRSLTYNR